MAYKATLKTPVYRSLRIEDVQGYADLSMIWRAMKEAEAGKRKPFDREQRKRIAKGLKRTMHEGATNRTKALAASIIMAALDEDWKRNVQRGIKTPHSKVARARAAKGKGQGRSQRNP